MTAPAPAPAPTIEATLPCLSGIAAVATRGGTVWVAFSDEGWPQGHPAARPWVSRPAGPGTAAELRALATAVEAALASLPQGGV